MSAVTQWFESDKPARQGVYQRLNKTTGLVYFAAFDGCWYGGSQTAEGAERLADELYVSLRQMDPNFPWRGLAEKPA